MISDLLEQNASIKEKENGADLADFLLKYDLEQFRSCCVEIKTDKMKAFDRILENNPLVKRLIDVFDLEV